MMYWRCISQVLIMSNVVPSSISHFCEGGGFCEGGSAAENGPPRPRLRMRAARRVIREQPIFRPIGASHELGWEGRTVTTGRNCSLCETGTYQTRSGHDAQFKSVIF